MRKISKYKCNKNCTEIFTSRYLHYDTLLYNQNAQVHLLNCGLTHVDNIQQN